MYTLTIVNFLLALLSTMNMVWCEEGGMVPVIGADVGCQHWLTSGRDYDGAANTTVTGIPCQKWSDIQPYNHPHAHVGDHNFCRNPGSSTNYKV